MHEPLKLNAHNGCEHKPSVKFMNLIRSNNAHTSILFALSLLMKVEAAECTPLPEHAESVYMLHPVTLNMSNEK